MRGRIKDPFFNVYKDGGNVENKSKATVKDDLIKLAADKDKLEFDFKSGISERIVRDYYKERKPGQSITDWLDTKPREYFLNIPLELSEGGKVLFLSDYLKQKQKPKIKRLNLDSAAPGKSLSELTEAEREVVNKLLKLTFGGDE